MKKIFFFLALCIFVIIIIHLITSIYTLWHKQDVLTQAEKQLQKEQDQQKNLKKQLYVVEQPSFLEEEARNKLFMTKKGEGEVMIAQNVLSPAPVSTPQKDTRPYWQQWLAVFSH